MIIEKRINFEIDIDNITDDLENTVRNLKDRYLEPAIAELSNAIAIDFLQDKDKLPQKIKVSLVFEVDDMKKFKV